MKLSQFIDGLQIIQKHEKDGYCLRAEHDQFWVSSADLKMPTKDSKHLVELGWFQDEEADGWSAYV